MSQVDTLCHMATNKRERSGYSDAVAAQVRQERIDTGLTQADVYGPAGLSRSTYIRIERGDHVLDVSQLAGICVPLQTTPAGLLERVEVAMIAGSAVAQPVRKKGVIARTAKREATSSGSEIAESSRR